MDVFYTSSTGPDGEAPQPAPPGTEAPRTETGETGETGEAEARVRSALERVKLADSHEWKALLEQAGFTPAEAGRLIFERVRPRDEGRVRN